MTDSSNTPAPVIRSALTLGLLALLGTGILSWVYSLAEPRIAEQERLQLLRQLQQVLPADRFDNAMHEDFIDVADETYFPGGQVVRVFRAWQGDEPAAVVIRLAAPDGYNGRISLLVGILTSGKISGVRVLEHNETPGLGDGIEIQRSDWIKTFDGKSLENPGAEGWAVKRDDGEFDQFTGATITPRAVVRAVKRALQYFDANGVSLFGEDKGE